MNSEIKDGIYVKFDEQVNYYAAQTESALRELPKIEGKNRKTFKQKQGKVTVQNKLVSITVHDDGRFEVRPHKQMEQYL